MVDNEDRADKLERPNARRSRNLGAFVFVFCPSIAVSEEASKKQKTPREIRTQIERTWTKNRSKIDGKSTKIDEKSTKIRSWTVWDAQSRFEDMPGRAPDSPGTPKSRPRTDLGAPQASQERPGAVPKRPRSGFKTFSGRPGTMPERIWSVERC